MVNILIQAAADHVQATAHDRLAKDLRIPDRLPHDTTYLEFICSGCLSAPPSSTALKLAIGANTNSCQGWFSYLLSRFSTPFPHLELLRESPRSVSGGNFTVQPLPVATPLTRKNRPPRFLHIIV